MHIICPVCDAAVNLSVGTEVSEIISCPECQARIVVEEVGEKPKVKIAPKIEEDWGE